MHTGIVTFCVSITFTMLFILTTVFSVITLSSVFSLIAVCSEWSVSAVFSIFTVSGVSGVFIARGPFQSRRGADSSHREAALLSTMNHPNIVAFRDSFEADEHLYIVMEYCAGGDILQRIKGQRNALFTQDVILNWFGQMCLGTKYIHDQRVLHRDLKSKNIFLASNGAVKLGDFGSACVLKSSEAYAYTYVGTPYYVSPEIWDSKPYNNKSDVWSLGCVLYELCTLRHPFQAASWKSLILKVCRGAYPPLPSHLPYELHHLIKHMFKTNPRDRPSLNTILTSHRISRLLRKHLPPQVLEGGQAGKWKKKEGVKVATYLGQKSLLESSRSLAGSCAEPMDKEERKCPRRKWVERPSESVLEILRNADLTSSTFGSSVVSQERSSTQSTPEDPGTTGPRRQWDKRPPERLLSLLEKAPVSLAFETYTVHREAGGNPLVGPLSQAGWDDTDGLAEDLLDSQRLEPRSDDEDTDFEEDSPCDLIGELEKITLSL
ncbi:serine/threonine-protein kinase Nek3 isoform X2 [Scleropages formosus]|uniref:serine/threonine-protein kinase Nek3 isoform X2 n=1 Tax=Scleropages formosus TaxID=113540 RepID=UPI0010FA7E44|nr:serine/threonine-protein kinase Nek3 isoform X2 [Scleropages formosus]